MDTETKKLISFGKFFKTFHLLMGEADKLTIKGKPHQRVSARQLYAFIYFAFNDLSNEPKEMNKLRFGDDRGKMEFMNARNMTPFLTGDDPWLYQEPVDGRSNVILLTKRGRKVCNDLVLAIMQAVVIQDQRQD